MNPVPKVPVLGNELPQETSRLHGDNGILALRHLLAAAVIASHSWTVLQANDTREPIMIITRGQMNGGALAVDAFFTVSGFLVCQSLARSRSVIEFLLRRVLRIYPAFLVVCLLQGLLLVPAVTGDWHSLGHGDTLVRVLLFGVTLGGAGDPSVSEPAPFASNPFGGHLNASLWTIRPEFLCYVLLAALGAAGLTRIRPIRLALLLGCTFLFAVSPDWDWDESLKAIFGTFYYWPRFLAFFVAGVCLCHDGNQLPKSRSACLLVSSALCLSSIHPMAFRAALPILGAWLLFASFSNRWLIQLSRRIPGDISFGLYLMGFPCQQLLVLATGANWHPALFGGVAVLLTALPAAASWRAIEKPTLALRHSLPKLLGGNH